MLPGLTLLGTLVHEGGRAVLPDNSVRIPSWTRLDLAARYTLQTAGNTRTTLRAGIDNVTNERIPVPVRPRLPLPAGAAHGQSHSAGGVLRHRRRRCRRRKAASGWL
jgi:outer membrane receptor protein involved in Fe transport